MGVLFFKHFNLLYLSADWIFSHLQVNYEPDPSWNESVQTEDYDLAWIPTNSPGSTTSPTRHLPLPGISTTTAESGQRRTSTDPLHPITTTQSVEVLSHSETAHGSTSTQPPGGPLPPGVKGRGDSSRKAPFYSTTTTTATFVSTSTAPFYSSAKTHRVLGGISPDDGVSPTSSFASSETDGGKSVISNSITTTTLKFRISDMSSTTTASAFDQADTNRGRAQPINEDTTPELAGLPEIQAWTSQPSASGEADSRRPTTSSVPSFSASTASVWLSGVLLQTTQPLLNGERPSVFPSSSSSSPLCDTADPNAAPSSCLHDLPSSSWPVLSASASESQHAASAQFSSKGPASPSNPTLPSSTLPHLPQPSLPLSDWETHSVFPGVGFDDHGRDGELLSGSSPVSSGDQSVFSDTPPLRTVPDPTGTSVASDFSWDPSLSTASLSINPTLQSSVFLNGDFTLSGAAPGSSHTFSTGFEDTSYATGSTIESFFPEVSGDGFPLASDVDALCGCSLEPSASTSWMHVSPHSPLPSSAWDSAPIELSSSVSFPSSSGVGVDDLLHSLSSGGSDGPSLGQTLLSYSAISPLSSTSRSLLAEATHSDLPVSVAATAPSVRDPSFSASDGNSARHTAPTASPSPPTSAQVLDASSSASGSALFPDSQEDGDQEWDRVQSSAYEESTLPSATEVANTVSPSTTSDQSGQTPDDLDDRSSAFYFESESGSAITSEIEGTVTPAVPVVTSALPWSVGREEESGSGQGDGLYDNETSSDFSISESTDRESEEEEPVEGKKKTHLLKAPGSGRNLHTQTMTNLPSKLLFLYTCTLFFMFVTERMLQFPFISIFIIWSSFSIILLFLTAFSSEGLELFPLVCMSISEQNARLVN